MRMYVPFRWLSLVGAALVVMAMAWGLAGVSAQAPSPQDATSTSAIVGSRIHFQGTLIESGEPVNGAATWSSGSTRTAPVQCSSASTCL